MVINAIRLAERNAESPIFSGFYIYSPIVTYWQYIIELATKNTSPDIERCLVKMY